MMDYTSRYGLEFNPFLKNSKEVLVETEQYREASLRLGYLLQTKGFGLLTGGAGRGLAIVRRIARLHGGDVSLAAVKPHGCRFTLSIPL